jgi:hypothetical protein
VSEEEPCKAHLRAFLVSLFESASREAKQLFPLTKYAYAGMVKAFYDFFKESSKRDAFYKQMVLDASASKAPATQEGVSNAFKDLVAYLQEHCSDWPDEGICPILISMDEVHVLCSPHDEKNASNHTLYSRLKSVLSGVVSEAFCVICLSTATSVSTLAPSKAVAPSLRERGENIVLPSPFTELPFDAYINADPLVPGTATLSSVGSIEFTAKFGRPLCVSFILWFRNLTIVVSNQILFLLFVSQKSFQGECHFKNDAHYSGEALWSHFACKLSGHSRRDIYSCSFSSILS